MMRHDEHTESDRRKFRDRFRSSLDSAHKGIQKLVIIISIYRRIIFYGEYEWNGNCDLTGRLAYDWNTTPPEMTESSFIFGGSHESG